MPARLCGDRTRRAARQFVNHGHIRVNGRKVDTIAMLHPAYLLRQPAQKRDAWHDLLQIRERGIELGLFEK